MHIAALITCHNRREKTLACLHALFACARPAGCELTVYLLDDASQDGTAQAVCSAFPLVTILHGDGNLYWNGGMRCALGAAMAVGYDFYLWLNDDTLLYPQALLNLFACKDQLDLAPGGPSNIIVGATCDAVSGQLTYGGLTNRSRWSPHYYVNLPVSDKPQACKTLNGNCVLVPHAVVETIGNIDAAFVHAIGDWDYGFRARRAGFGVWMAPGFVGTCSQNPPNVVPLAEVACISAQLRKACSPKRVPPKAWRTFVQRHYGVFWLFYFVRPYASVVLRGLSAKVKNVISQPRTQA